MSETRPHESPTILGSVLGNYRILSEISSGGMGTVYRAEHVLLRRLAAVKLLHPELTTDADLVERFVNEAKAVTACKHPGIVELYDFGYTDDGHAFIVMEFLEGESLGHRLARGPISEREAAGIAHGIASALKAAHRVGVIHRDLKPDNVFLVPDPDGGPDRTKVLDFGIAKLTDASSTSMRRTETGILMGTPRYMSPEQAREVGMIDPRADLYSLGCILYHMLVGQPPFVAEGDGEVIALQLFAPVVPPSRLAPVTPEMEWVVLRLLEKEPADRFDSAAALATALATFDTLLANRPTWPLAPPSAPSGLLPGLPSGFSDLAPTLPPDGGAPRLGDAPAPGPAPSRRSAVPIIAGLIAVLGIVGAGLAYAMLREDRAVPAPLGSAVAPAPAAGSGAAPSPVATPDTTVMTKPSGELDEQAPHAAHVAPTGQGATKPTKPTKSTKPTNPSDGASTGAGRGPLSGDSGLPDKAIEVIREIRPIDPPKLGEHTQDGSPIETTIELDTRRPKPVAPDAPKERPPSSPPSSDSPKGPTSP